MAALPRDFYERDTVAVARDLLGQRLVRLLAGHRLSGLISEVEAYRGPDDPASHAYRRTPRSAIMYGHGGRAYVYLIYGRNHCLNAVTERDGEPGAVLIRAILPEEGLGVMRVRRGPVPERRLADGPGKLCAAMGIDRDQNGTDLTAEGELFIETGPGAPTNEITMTPRVGVRGDDETRARPWRFVWRDPYPKNQVSGGRR